MTMQVHVKRELYDDRLGRLRPGRVVELPDAKAAWHMKRGEVEPYSTKVLRDRPTPTVGDMQQSSASPPVPASPQTTSSESAPGKKRGRPRKEPA